VIIGTTSWQVPGTYLENCDILKKSVDFVELLIYSWDDDIKELIQKEIDSIESQVKYSVHLPTNTLEHIKSAGEFFSSKKSFNMVMHPLGDLEEFRKVFLYLKKKSSDKISLENLENDKFEIYYEKIKDLNPKITMDYGHLILKEKSPENFIKNYSNICEIHFHGVVNNKDHSEPSIDQIKIFKNFYSKYFKDIPICVETFKLEKTLNTIKELKML